MPCIEGGEAGIENSVGNMGVHWRHRLARLLGKILTAEEECEITQEERGGDDTWGHRQMRLNPVQEGAESGCLGRKLEDCC